jgi:Domain of Unknown Function (DUF748)
MPLTRRLRWILAVGALLVLARALLPVALQRYVNHTLDAIPDYDGQIGDVDLSLWRGAYQIQDVSLVKTTGRVPVPLFSAPRVDLSVEWGQLGKGRLVGEIELTRPVINIVSGPTDEDDQARVDASWIERVKDLFPLRLNRVAVHQGTVHYLDFHSNPKVDVVLKDVEGAATNLTNQATPGVELPAGIHILAVPPGGGSFRLAGTLAPLAAQPTFSIDATLEGVGLPALNDFLRAYANVDAEGGTFSAYAELAAADGGFRGYVKPLMKDIQVAKWRDEESFARKLWEGIVQFTAKILENPDNERVATRIPLKGRFDEPQPDLWATIGGLLRNAFVQALLPGIEGSIGAPVEGRLTEGPDPSKP